MKAVIATTLVLLLVAITAVVVLWLTPSPTASFPPPSAGEPPNGWKRIAGAAMVGAGAYAGRSEGAAATTSLAQGIGYL